MDNSCQSSDESTAAAATNSSGSYSYTNSNQYLKQLNKHSVKICKPTITANAAVKRAAFEPPPPPRPYQSNNQGNIHPNQPPVYNINKNDFRDVVQRLTGSSAHERISSASPPPPPPPVHHPKPQSSRLQSIRPPPLAQVGNRPSSILNNLNPNPNPNPNPNFATGVAAGFVPRLTAPLSPLPPLPSVHGAAESPVSAYMRFLHSSVSSDVSNPKEFFGFSPSPPLVSPSWHQTNPPPPPSPPPSQPTILTSVAPQQQSAVPPAPFGCLNSPRSPYALFSPSLLFSPTSSHLGFPLSPTVAIPGPKFD